MHNSRKWIGVWLCVQFLLSSCATFKSVEVTSELGQKLQTPVDAWAHTRDVCNLGFHPNTEAWRARCAKVETASQRWNAMVKALYQYAVALGKMATNEDTDVSGDLGAALESISALELASLDEEEASEISKAVDALLKAVSAGYRQQAIKEAVNQADNPIQIIKEASASITNRQVDNLKALTEDLENGVADYGTALLHGHENRDGGAAAWFPEPDKTRATQWAIAHAMVWTKERIEKLEEQRKFIEAFAVSHAKLKENVNSIGQEDDQIYRDILKEITSIFTN